MLAIGAVGASLAALAGSEALAAPGALAGSAADAALFCTGAVCAWLATLPRPASTRPAAIAIPFTALLDQIMRMRVVTPVQIPVPILRQAIRDAGSVPLC